uniref:Uncharacterized protein n=1 Tax=Lygus hesperus TaxID=30085 RepID=A0A0A9WXV9_LYGHE
MDSSDNWIAEGLIEENRRKSVPGLHPGLNDLIRVLGKQAHCVSRTLILCEPHIPTRVRKTKFHKHCSPTKKNKSDSGISSKAALWTPIRPQNYYYDCFNYTNYPERETDYQDIELKYNAMKEKPLHYEPPKCDEKKIRRSLESPDVKHKKYKDYMQPQKTKKPVIGVDDLEFSTTSLAPKLLTSSEEVQQKDQQVVQVFSSQETEETVTTDGSAGESSDESSVKVKFQSDSTESSDESRSKIKRKPTGWVGPGGGLKTPESVPCSELLDLQNLIRKSDRENFERMQQMLLLMKELSAKDFCRATCDQTLDKTGYGKGNVTPSGEHLSEKSQISAPKSVTTPQSSEGKLNQNASRDHLTDSSTSSVQSSSGKDLSSERSKSSNKVLESSSESSFEHHPIPYLHDTEEETSSSDVEDRPTTSESSFGKPGIGPVSSESGEKIKSEQSVAATRSDASQNMKATDSSRSFKSEHSGGQMNATDSSPSMKSKHSSAKSSDSVRDRSKQSHPENGQNNVVLTVCDSPMTVHELVEVSNIITDILVLETVKELIKVGKYCPPSWREGASSPSMISASTSGPPFEVIKEALPKPVRPDSSLREQSNTKSVSLPSPSLLESYKASKGSSSAISPGSLGSKSSAKPELIRDEEEPKFEAMKSEISGAGSLRSMGSKKSGDAKSVISSMKSVGEISKAESIKPKTGDDISGVGSQESDESKKEGDDKSGMSSMKSVGETSKVESIKSKTGGDISGVGSPISEGSKKEGIDKLGMGSMKSMGEISKEETIKSKIGGDVSGVGSLKSEGSKKEV